MTPGDDEYNDGVAPEGDDTEETRRLDDDSPGNQDSTD